MEKTGTSAETAGESVLPQLVMPDLERGADFTVAEQERSSNFSRVREEESAYSSVLAGGPVGVERVTYPSVNRGCSLVSRGMLRW